MTINKSETGQKHESVQMFRGSLSRFLHCGQKHAIAMDLSPCSSVYVHCGQSMASLAMEKRQKHAINLPATRPESNDTREL